MVEEYPLKILRELHVRFGRCFRTGGGSWARLARSWDIWCVVALSEGTSLLLREIGSCDFSEILYGGSWGGMRRPHKILGQSEVVWLVNPRFEKTAKIWRLLAEFHIGMAVVLVLRLG